MCDGGQKPHPRCKVGHLFTLLSELEVDIQQITDICAARWMKRSLEKPF